MTVLAAAAILLALLGVIALAGSRLYNRQHRQTGREIAEDLFGDPALWDTLTAHPPQDNP